MGKIALTLAATLTCLGLPMFAGAAAARAPVSMLTPVPAQPVAQQTPPATPPAQQPQPPATQQQNPQKPQPATPGQTTPGQPRDPVPPTSQQPPVQQQPQQQQPDPNQPQPPTQPPSNQPPSTQPQPPAASSQGQSEPQKVMLTGVIRQQGNGYVLNKSGEIYTLDAPAKARKFVGKTVNVIGTLDAANHTLKVDDIQPSS
jgi:outer membrane biosynthesis protein TonB